MATTITTVRTSIAASNMATLLTERINKERKKLKKDELSKSKVIAIAIENLDIKSAVAL